MRTINIECLTFEQELWRYLITLRDQVAFYCLNKVFTCSLRQHQYRPIFRRSLSQLIEARHNGLVGSGIALAINCNVTQALNEGAVREI